MSGDDNLSKWRTVPSPPGLAGVTLPTACLLAALYLIAFQELVASMMLSAGIPVLAIRAFLLLKEFIILGVGAGVALRRPRQRVVLVVSVLLCYAGFFLVVTPLPISLALADFRIYPLMAASFLVGHYLGTRPQQAGVFWAHARLLLLLIVAFGIIEHFMFPNSMFQQAFPLERVDVEVKGYSGAAFLLDGTRRNIATRFGKRLLGPFGEPLYMAYFTVILLDLAFAKWFFDARKKLDLTVALGLVAIVLTQVRAIWLGLLVSSAYLLLRVRHARRIAVLLLVLAVPMWFAMDFLWKVALSSFDVEAGTALAHYQAYVHGVPRILQNPWGYGIGSFGLMSAKLSSEGSLSVENAYLNVAGEIGIVGMGIILGVSIYLSVKGKAVLRGRLVDASSQARSLLLAATLLSVQFVCAGFVAPHIMTARIAIPFWALTGAGYAVLGTVSHRQPWSRDVLRTRDGR